ncbi:hypothetical protein BCEN4_1420024 [Burkholderia cenocepacia]|nr:hypothetical protein BCEN4_1420024 [Burkholderia cenocepacia]
MRVHRAGRPFAVRPGARRDQGERSARDLARLRHRPLQAARVHPVGRARGAGRFAESAGARLRDAVGRVLDDVGPRRADDARRRDGHAVRAAARRRADRGAGRPARRHRRMARVDDGRRVVPFARRIGDDRHRVDLHRMRAGVPARHRRRDGRADQAAQGLVVNLRRVARALMRSTIRHAGEGRCGGLGPSPRGRLVPHFRAAMHHRGKC